MELVTFNDTTVYVTDDDTSWFVLWHKYTLPSITCKRGLRKANCYPPFYALQRTVIYPPYHPEVVTLFSALYVLLFQHSDLPLISTMTHLFSAFFHISATFSTWFTSTQKMEAECASTTLAHKYQTIWCHRPEDHSLHSLENFKS
jgi:hypothetical protein